MTLVSWNSKVFHWLLYKIVRSWQLQVIDKLIETNAADSALLYKTCHVVHDVLQTYRTWLGKIYEIVQVRSKFQAKNFTTLDDGTWRKWLEKILQSRIEHGPKNFTNPEWWNFTNLEWRTRLSRNPLQARLNSYHRWFLLTEQRKPGGEVRIPFIFLMSTEDTS